LCSLILSKTNFKRSTCSSYVLEKTITSSMKIQHKRWRTIYNYFDEQALYVNLIVHTHLIWFWWKRRITFYESVLTTDSWTRKQRRMHMRYHE
jgi:hypothetical protein